MIVWIVTSLPGADRDFTNRGVFSSREKAVEFGEKFVTRFDPDECLEEWNLDDIVQA